MRVHVTLEDDLVKKVDRRAGSRGRSAYIAKAVEHSLDDDERWEKIESAFASIADSGHGWDEDPAAWVRSQRRAEEQLSEAKIAKDRRRIG